MDCNTQERLNITMGTDVVLNDTLLFDGETFDPELSTDIVVNLVSGTGRRTELEAVAADGILVISIPWVEGRSAGLYGLEITGKCNGKKWTTYADSLIYYTRSTRQGETEVEVDSDEYEVTQVVAFRYSTSPINAVNAVIDAGVGIPKVDADYDGDELDFDFKNIKGNGIASMEAVEESTEDGGANVHRITDDLGNEHDITVYNGHRGTHGNDGKTTVLNTEGGDPEHPTVYTLYPDKGDNTDGTMTQKAITSELNAVGRAIKYRVDDCFVRNKYITPGGSSGNSSEGYARTNLIPLDASIGTLDIMVAKSLSVLKLFAYTSTETLSDSTCCGAAIDLLTLGTRYFSYQQVYDLYPTAKAVAISLRSGTDELDADVVAGWYLTKSGTVDERIGILDGEVAAHSASIASLNDATTKLAGTSALNQVSGLDTATPSMLFLQTRATALSSGWGPVANIVDTESPFKDRLGYLTKLSRTSSSGSYYCYENTSASSATRSNRPTKITFSFWLNEDDFANFGEKGFTPSIRTSNSKTARKSFKVKTLMDQSVGYEDIVNDFTSDVFDGKVKISHLAKNGKWHQVAQCFYDLTWNIGSSIKWEYGMYLNNTQTYWTNIRMANTQIVENDDVPVGAVIQDVNETLTDFDGGMAYLETKVAELSNDVEELQQAEAAKTCTFNYESGNTYIESNLTPAKKIRLNLSVSRTAEAFTRNPNLNWSTVTVNGSNVHSCGDELGTEEYNYTVIGGNHGDSGVRALTSASHGKTYADIGSVWTDGTYEYTIIGIDTNVIYVLGENYATYPKWHFRYPGTGTLTHVRGATNTGNITVTAVGSSTQMRPSISVSTKTIYVDGKEVTEYGSYKFSELKICEIYDVFNSASVLEKIQENVGQFTANPLFNELGADKVARNSIVYTWKGADMWFIAKILTFYQNVGNFDHSNGTMQMVLEGIPYLYIPKALPIGGKDYRTPTNISSHSSEVNITSSFWENGQLPPDRWLEYTSNIGLASGYLFDYGVGGSSRKDYVNTAFQISSAKKVYPYAVDGKVTPVKLDSFSTVAFRRYIDPDSINQGGVICCNVFEYDNKLYIYADYNDAGFYEIDIPAKYIGKTVEVFEKSGNVKLLTTVSASKLLVSVTMGEDDVYGYMVAQIK